MIKRKPFATTDVQSAATYEIMKPWLAVRLMTECKRRYETMSRLRAIKYLKGTMHAPEAWTTLIVDLWAEQEKWKRKRKGALRRA